MKLTSPPLRSAVAADYLLGNLGARAGRRFERLLAADAALRDAVDDWRSRLDAVAPPSGVTPPDEVWTRISRELDEMEKPVRRRLARVNRRRLRLWQAGTGLAAAATAVFAALLLNAPAPAPPEAAAAIATAPAGAAARPSQFWHPRSAARGIPAAFATTLQLPRETAARWRISLSPDQRLLRVQSIGYPMLAADEDYELWWVGEEDIVPVGLLPRSGSWVLSLPRQLHLTSSSRLVITREPALGSPADGPTGPVLMNTALRSQG
ncbi:MAG: hypothetical protein NVS9B10_07400 [Nevskia sp.]